MASLVFSPFLMIMRYRGIYLNRFGTNAPFYEIGWGESIVQKIQDGLKCSRYVVVVVSAHLVKKPCAQKELRTALAQEIEADQTGVLPLLVGEPRSLLYEVPLLKEWLIDLAHPL
jgi:hypothetical protein